MSLPRDRSGYETVSRYCMGDPGQHRSGQDKPRPATSLQTDRLSGISGSLPVNPRPALCKSIWTVGSAILPQKPFSSTVTVRRAEVSAAVPSRYVVGPSPPQIAPQPARGSPSQWSRTARRARPGCVPPPNPPACAACPAARVWYLTQSLDVQTDAVTVTVLKIVCKYQLSFFVVLECRKFAWNSESPGPRALIQAASPVLMRTTGFSPRKI